MYSPTFTCFDTFYRTTLVNRAMNVVKMKYQS